MDFFGPDMQLYITHLEPDRAMRQWVTQVGKLFQAQYPAIEFPRLLFGTRRDAKHDMIEPFKSNFHDQE
jgi:hypothetical protein